jgi:hypothetical protein
MRRTMFGFAFVTLLMSALFAPRLVAADDQQDTTVAYHPWMTGSLTVTS